MTSASHSRFPIATTDHLPGARIVSYCGLARGSSVRAAPLTGDVIARVQNVVGGEIPAYTKIIAEVREESLDRLIEHARSLGANAVVGLRFCTSEVTDEAAELMAYGTAVTIEQA